MPVFLLLTCLATIAISFVCSLTEAVLLSLNPLRLKAQRDRPDGSARRWLALKNHIERPISAILALNTIANTGLATLAGAIFIQTYGASWLWLFSLVMTVSLLFAGELAPKIIGVHHAEKAAPILIGLLTLLVKLTHPLIVFMEFVCERLKSKKSSDSNSDESASSQIMDIITLTQAAQAEQVLHNREEIIIIHAATLSARRVRSAMVPLESVRFFDRKMSLLQNVENTGAHLHRSYPVVADNQINLPEGYIRVRELFAKNLLSNGLAEWTPLIRPVQRISAEASLTQLLALFLEKHEIAAIVENRQGGIIGWITMDDVTQVLMGERV